MKSFTDWMENDNRYDSVLSDNGLSDEEITEIHKIFKNEGAKGLAL
tara:strand:+ start:162 stop:299 length:138 start_codon:yes stop_codon:yes gene_type:complete